MFELIFELLTLYILDFKSCECVSQKSRELGPFMFNVYKICNLVMGNIRYFLIDKKNFIEWIKNNGLRMH